jgi:hypothetical protein
MKHKWYFKYTLRNIYIHQHLLVRVVNVTFYYYPHQCVCFLRHYQLPNMTCLSTLCLAAVFVHSGINVSNVMPSRVDEYSVMVRID